MPRAGVIAWLVFAAVIVTSSTPVRGEPYEVVYEHFFNGDENSHYATFLGHGVLMLGESGPGYPREARVFSARSGRLRGMLDCPPIDYALDLSQRCPTALAASARLFVVKDSIALRVFSRDGEFLRDIVPPLGFPIDHFDSSRGVAVRGRRIAVGGPAYESGMRVPGIVVHVFDGLTGALLDHHRIAAPQGHGPVDLAFAGRALVLRVPGAWPEYAPGLVAAIDARTGATLWSREAPVQPGGSLWGRDIVALGRDVIVGAHRLDGRTGDVVQTYENPGGGAYGGYGEAAAAAGRVAIADHQRSLVHLFSADDGSLMRTIEPPPELCDLFGRTVDLSASRLVVTSGSYCGAGHAFAFRLP